MKIKAIKVPKIKIKKASGKYKAIKYGKPKGFASFKPKKPKKVKSLFKI